MLAGYLILGVLSIVNQRNYYAIYLSLYGLVGLLLMIIHEVPTLGKKNMVFFYIVGVYQGVLLVTIATTLVYAFFAFLRVHRAWELE